MKKRFLALLTAMFLVLSSLLMTACSESEESSDNADDNVAESASIAEEGNNSGDTATSEESSEKAEELSPKDLFSSSIKNSVTDDSELKDFDFNEIIDEVTNPSTQSGKFNMNLVINELESGGQVILDSPVKLDYNIDFDAENGAAKADILFEMFGEKPSMSMIISENGFYLTDLLGVNDKPIFVTYEDMGISTDDFASIYYTSYEDMLDNAGLTEEDLEKIGELGNFVIETVEKAISENVTDEAYTIETKDVTVNGIDIKGAQIVTLTLTPDIAEGFIADVVTDMLANDTFKQLLEENEVADVTVDEIMESLTPELEKSFKYLKITNIIDNDKTVGLNIEFNGTVSTTEVDFDEDGELIETTTDEDINFGINCSYAGNTTKIQAGMLKDGSLDLKEGILTYEYTLNETNEKLAISFESDVEKVFALTFEGTKNGNKHEGVLSVESAEQKISITGSIESNENSATIIITEVTADMQGVKTTVPLEFKLAYTVTETKADFEISLKIDIKDYLTVDSGVALSYENTEVTVDTAPEGAVSYTEITEEELQAWEDKIRENFPTIYTIIESMNNASQEPNYAY